jgi:hypothetical protein
MLCLTPSRPHTPGRGSKEVDEEVLAEGEKEVEKEDEVAEASSRRPLPSNAFVAVTVLIDVAEG